MKFGAVSYLNALPLIHYLKEKPRLEPPAALDRLLRIGELDFATAPIITLFENPGYRLVPGISISTKGAVRSVRLVLRNASALSDIRSIYLDMESKTSAMLLKVLLHFKFKRRLEEIQFFHPIPSPNADAALLIGNKAMTPDVESQPSLDLGYEWTSWTGLPFVFAGWIGRADSCSPQVIHDLQTCRDRSLADLETLCSLKSPLSVDETRKYFQENVSYQLGEAEIEGMKRFHAYARELNLVQHDFRINLYPQG